MSEEDMERYGEVPQIVSEILPDGTEKPASPRIPRKRAARRAPAKVSATKRKSNDPAFHVIPEGMYALSKESGGYEVFKVDVPSNGRWAGYRFVRVQDAAGVLHRVLDMDEVFHILDRIALMPSAARKQYERLVKTGAAK